MAANLKLVDDNATPNAVEDEADIVAYWLSEIGRATKAFKEWNDRCDKINKRYRDERDAAKKGARKFNILWSNIQTMKPAVYSRPPKPVIERRFLERNDVERTAGTLLERAAIVEMENGCFDESIGGKQGCVLDYLLFSRGQVWLRYEAEFDEEDDESVETNLQNKADEGVQQAQTRLPTVTSEGVVIDYVNRTDYLHDPARTWAEVRWNAKRSWLTRRQAKAKFPKVYKDVEYKDMNADAENRDNNDRKPVEKRAEFWEIWDKPRRIVWVISPSLTDKLVSQQDDPLNLKNFWPCPRPLYGTMTTDTLVPVPDYTEYQDQADELDDLSERISRLTAAVKACGVYDASQPEIAQLFQVSVDNKLIPSENWGTFKERGGVAGSIELLPLDMLVKALEVLEGEFDKKLSRLYEITGIADIIRGNTDPDETYGAQKIKGQFATLRLKDKQKDVAIFCRDILRIMVELIAGHFSPETLAAMTGLADTNLLQQMGQNPLQGQLPPPQPMPGQQQPLPQGQPGQIPPGQSMVPQAPQQPPQPPKLTNPQEIQLKQVQSFQAALKLIKDSRLRTFRIEIENMSTVEMDIETDKESAKELLEGVGRFATGVLPVGEKVPQLMPLFGSMMLMALRKFRSGREIESTMEEAMDKLEGLSEQLIANPRPDPEMAKVQQAQAEAQQKGQLAQQQQKSEAEERQARFQFEQLQHQDDMQSNAQQHAQKMEFEAKKHQDDMIMREKEMQHEMLLKHQDREHATSLKHKELDHNANLKQQEMDLNRELEDKRIAGMKTAK